MGSAALYPSYENSYADALSNHYSPRLFSAASIKVSAKRKSRLTRASNTFLADAINSRRRAAMITPTTPVTVSPSSDATARGLPSRR